MTARRSIVGLAVLCALLFSAVTAAGASAASGTTVFTCSKSAEVKSFSDADCSKTEGTKEYGHVAVAAETATELNAEGGAQILKGTIAGIPVELSATKVEIKPGTTPTITNTSTTPMSYSGKATFTYTGVKLTVPKEQHCTVTSAKGGGVTEAVETKPLSFQSIIGTTATTTGVKFTPETGTVFATIYTSGCATPALSGEFNVTGTAVGTPTGANVKFTAASTAGLVLAGQKATLEGEATVSGRANSKDTYKPLSTTTTAS